MRSASNKALMPASTSAASDVGPGLKFNGVTPLGGIKEPSMAGCVSAGFSGVGSKRVIGCVPEKALTRLCGDMMLSCA